jgi:hypothetical protein
MKKFEYEITQHPAADFMQVTYFCTETGECSLNDVPRDQAQVLSGILNERGKAGWELVQVTFGRDGAMAFWKRKIKEKQKA